MRLAAARYRDRWRWDQKVLGRFVIPTAADKQRLRINFNRYPHKVIGLAVYFGGRRYLSWVWPVWAVDLPLTDEQKERDDGPVSIGDAVRRSRGGPAPNHGPRGFA